MAGPLKKKVGGEGKAIKEKIAFMELLELKEKKYSDDH